MISAYFLWFDYWTVSAYCCHVYYFFLQDWGVNLAVIQLISKYNKRTRHLLWAIDLFSKYAWVVPLKDKKGITVVHAFRKSLDNSTKYGLINVVNFITNLYKNG